MKIMKKLKQLPIDGFKREIIETVEKNPVTVLVAETGAGKSTRVPALIHAEGYEVVVTQPRRMAVKSVAKRVATESGCQLGETVGFRTAVDRKDSRETEILFVTDGLQLVRELTQQGQTNKKMCLIIDEVHEWNKNIETLVAWLQKMISEGFNIKLVLMSATLDAERLSEYFGSAPVIDIPGRCFPVEGSPKQGKINQVSDENLIEEIKDFALAGKNTLVFLPGKKEITETQALLEKAKLGIKVLPLHGDLDPNEQDLIFRSYVNGKIILSTNIAQTSVTIEDIDAVVDSGLERRMEIRNGVETLVLGNISQADVKQRAGRAGRVRPGQYVLCNDADYTEFSAFPIPEIMRTRLDQTVLRLAGAGLDATELEFFHNPGRESLLEARETLVSLGALTQDGKITKTGRKINRFPTSVVAAKMILESVRFNCTSAVIDIAAIMATNYMSVTRKLRDSDPQHFRNWEQLVNWDREYLSDLIVEREVFLAAKKIDKKRLAENGISPKSFFRVMEVRTQLREAIKSLGIHTSREVSKFDQIPVVKSIAAGMVNHFYKKDSYGYYEDFNGNERQCDRKSNIGGAKYLVGQPKNIQFRNRRGNLMTIELVTACTRIQEEWLPEIAPQLLRTEMGLSPYVNSETKTVFSTTKKYFGTFLLEEKTVEDAHHEQAASLLSEFFERQEKRRIENAFSELQSEIGKTSWISEVTEVYPFLGNILSQYVVTQDANGNDIFGWLGLYSDSDPDFKVLLYKTLEEAQEVTKIALKRLMQKSLRQTKKEVLEGIENSQLQTTIVEAIDQCVDEVLPNLSCKNFMTQYEKLVSTIREIRMELDKKYAERKQELDAFKEAVLAQLEKVSDEYVSVEKQNLSKEIFELIDLLVMNNESIDVYAQQFSEKITRLHTRDKEIRKEIEYKQAERKRLTAQKEKISDDISCVIDRSGQFNTISYADAEKMSSLIDNFDYYVSTDSFQDADDVWSEIIELVEILKPQVIESSLENLASLWGAKLKK